MADDDPGAPDEVADALFAVDPSEFVERRAELVRRLRGEKRREEAARVAKLRRPSPAAWAVNQLVRTNRAEVEELLRLGEELRDAQDRALGGSGAAELRQAGRDRRDAVAALTGAAARLLAQRGGGVDAHLPGVTATLEAASLDAEAGATVLAGRLAAELEPPSGFGGFGFDVDLVAPPARQREAPPAPAPGPAPAAQEAERALGEARRRAEELAEAATAAAARVDELRAAMGEAEADVGARRRALEDAEHRLAAATAATRDAQEAADEAAAAADSAAAELEDAEHRLAAATAATRDAQEAADEALAAAEGAAAEVRDAERRLHQARG